MSLERLTSDDILADSSRTLTLYNKSLIFQSYSKKLTDWIKKKIINRFVSSALCFMISDPDKHKINTH